ncbi:sugar kinase [Citreicella sp. C3M06]|uniref:sugar kinase n=1 Tax=Citreicella sp. C3M06 TaxID=2841564 RepID=UPI001C087E57|nr:sugar kinase [Citreicella sp. C3M06]MBU2962795.1 sugar kinase [Citreicella sp. C3M06]
MRFISIGECMVELAPDAAGQVMQGFAGDTFNTLWYLRRLRPDVDCGYHTCVGQDALSGRFLDMLRAEGIDTDYVHRRSDRTMGLYMIALKDGERSFSYWRETSAARKLAENRGRLRRTMARADMVYFSGITLAILSEPARLRLFEAIDSARRQGARVAFDPNLRPALWRSPAEMRRWIMLGADHSDIVLPSFEDEQDHFADASPAATLARYAEARTVVVKNGPGAIHWREGGESGQVAPVPSAQPVDTTAAGDSFNAGFFATDQLSLPMDSRLTLAARVAGRVIAQRGALVPVTMEDILSSAA